MNEKLPPGLDLLWERLDAPTSEPKPGLSLSRIVHAAVELADAGGLDAVSMGRIAERLGFTTMSLYRHVKSKHEVLLLMLDAVATVPAELDEPCADWRLGLQRWCRTQWAMLHTHSWVTHLPIAGPPITPNQLAWTDRALAVLRDTGLTERDKAGVVLLIANYLLSAARLSTELGPAASGESVAAYSTLLGDLVDVRRFPALRTAIDAGAFDYPPDATEQERRFDYSFGLDRILDGVAALIRQHAG
ncbi:TetR/AcrR family transcriptional regulator [Plantactinospora mayteni]|uniref:TetR family transcriptional regulator n=1 Tax=Plantactinospora mayteni TaxID=566021 RepID=A0ABQ4F4G7_9ACTN|nr:TetR/AcrR family transcriptional regulator [Plantactinospora mayteni]GIH01772.1 TetR family transcriptional regulator [Plantactinospora mayteni]